MCDHSDNFMIPTRQFDKTLSEAGKYSPIRWGNLPPREDYQDGLTCTFCGTFTPNQSQRQEPS